MSLLKRRAPAPRLAILVIIGAHRDERAFGERGPCADVLCADTALLECLASGTALDGPASAERVRGVRLVASTDLTVLAPETEDWPVARPEIPEAVWNRDDPRYVGVEVYRRRPGDGAPEEWRLASALMDQISDCALTLSQTGRLTELTARNP